MKPTRIVFALALGVGAFAGGCQRGSDDPAALEQQLADMDERLKKLEAFLEPYLNQPPPPPEPDPRAVYAVPIAGYPFKGPEQAKVTVVEAFEFA